MFSFMDNGSHFYKQFDSALTLMILHDSRFKKFISISYIYTIHTKIIAKNKQNDIEEMAKGQKRPERAIS